MRDFCTGKGIRDSEWVIIDDKNQRMNLETNLDGEVAIEGLTYGTNYFVEFSAPGYISSRIIVNTQLVPPKFKSSLVTVSPQLYPKLNGLDTSFFVKYPAEMIHFDWESAELDFDGKYRDDLQSKLVGFQHRYQRAVQIQGKKCKALKNVSIPSEKEFLKEIERNDDYSFQVFGKLEDICSGNKLREGEVVFSNDEGEEIRIGVDRKGQFDSGLIALGYKWKIEFKANGYYSKHLFVDASNVVDGEGGFGFDFELALAPELEGFSNQLFEKTPIGIAYYDSIRDVLEFEDEYIVNLRPKLAAFHKEYLKMAEERGKKCKHMQEIRIPSEQELINNSERNQNESFHVFGNIKDRCTGEKIRTGEVVFSNSQGREIIIPIDENGEFSSGYIALGYKWKIEFIVNGYYSKHIIVDASDVEQSEGGFGFEFEIEFFPVLEGFVNPLLENSPISKVYFDSTRDVLDFDSEYTASLVPKYRLFEAEYRKVVKNSGMKCKGAKRR